MAEQTQSNQTQSSADKCAHPSCSCNARPGDQFCSDHCKTAGSDGQCGCGHKDCEGTQR